MIVEYLIKLGLSLLLGAIIGYEREKNDKPAGIRTIMALCFGATLISITTLEMAKMVGINLTNFDAIRGIAYYLVAIGFVGGGIVRTYKGKIDGITTGAILLPITIMGILIGLGKFELAILSFFGILVILMLKYVKIKIQLFEKKIEKYRRKNGY